MLNDSYEIPHKDFQKLINFERKVMYSIHHTIHLFDKLGGSIRDVVSKGVEKR